MIQAMTATIRAAVATVPSAQPGRQPQPVLREAVLSMDSPISSVTNSSPSGRTLAPPSLGGFFDLRRLASPSFLDLEGLLDLEDLNFIPPEREGLKEDLEDFLLLERLEPPDLRDFFMCVAFLLLLLFRDVDLSAGPELLPPFVLCEVLFEAQPEDVLHGDGAPCVAE